MLKEMSTSLCSGQRDVRAWTAAGQRDGGGAGFATPGPELPGGHERPEAGQARVCLDCQTCAAQHGGELCVCVCVVGGRGLLCGGRGQIMSLGCCSLSTPGLSNLCCTAWR